MSGMTKKTSKSRLTYPFAFITTIATIVDRFCEPLSLGSPNRLRTEWRVERCRLGEPNDILRTDCAWSGVGLRGRGSI